MGNSKLMTVVDINKIEKYCNDIFAEWNWKVEDLKNLLKIKKDIQETRMICILRK